MDFKIPVCLIRARRAPDIESISDQEPREPPLQFKILQDPDVKRAVKSKSRACKGSRAPPLQFRILPRPRCETWGEMQPLGLPGTSSSIQDTSRPRCKTCVKIEVPCPLGLGRLLFNSGYFKIPTQNVGENQSPVPARARAPPLQFRILQDLDAKRV